MLTRHDFLVEAKARYEHSLFASDSNPTMEAALRKEQKAWSKILQALAEVDSARLAFSQAYVTSLEKTARKEGRIL